MAAIDFPAKPWTTGQLTTDGKFKYNGTGWVRVKSSGSSGGAAMRTWASGTSFDYLEEIISPADKETYRRVAATGSDTVDPALETSSFKYVATSYSRVTELGRATNSAESANTSAWPGMLRVTAASSTARQELVNISGRGVIDFAALQWGGGSATRNVRIEVIIDGRTLRDATITTATANNGLVYIGSSNTGSSSFTPLAVPAPPIPYRRSLIIAVTQSIAAADLNLAYGYRKDM